MNSPNQRLCHDIAWATAHHIVEVFASLLREEEMADAMSEVYMRVKAGIECFAIESNRLEQRMRPTNN